MPTGFSCSLAYIKPGSVPLKHSTHPSRKAAPSDCGLCADHEQHSCLPIIEITNYCNLECPICIVQNRHNYNMTVPEFRSVIDGLIAKEGTLDTINLSGGEPTVHPQFLELLDLAKRPEIARVSISTNGVLIASDLEFCRELARRGTYVNLQLDALSNPELRDGCCWHAGDQEGLKRRALENLRAAGVRTSIVSTLAKGINDAQIGDCVRLLRENDFIPFVDVPAVRLHRIRRHLILPRTIRWMSSPFRMLSGTAMDQTMLAFFAGAGFFIRCRVRIRPVFAPDLSA